MNSLRRKRARFDQFLAKTSGSTAFSSIMPASMHRLLTVLSGFSGRAIRYFVCSNLQSIYTLRALQ